MKSIKTLVVVSALSVISFGAFAQSISTTASTLDAAEAKISAIAEQQGSHYTITSARVGDRVHMTANLDKYEWPQKELPESPQRQRSYFDNPRLA